MNTRARARRGEGAHLREELLDATERLLAATGDEEMVSVRAIAEAVGVSPPAIYLHFPDKDALIFEVCAARFAELDRFIEDAAAGVRDPIEALVVRGRAYVRFGVENPEQYRVLFMRRGSARALTPAELRETAAFGNLVKAVERAQQAGRLTSSEDGVSIAMELWAVAHGVTSLLIGVHGFPWPADFADRVLRTYVDGLRSRADTSS